MKETWKPIVGYEGLYEVSNLGRVRSLTRLSKFRNRSGKLDERVIKGRIMRPQKQRTGYLNVGLSKDGKVTLFRVHRLVAAAFIANPEGLYEVNHIDEDKTITAQTISNGATINTTITMEANHDEANAILWRS